MWDVLYEHNIEIENIRGFLMNLLAVCMEKIFLNPLKYGIDIDECLKSMLTDTAVVKNFFILFRCALKG